MKRITKLMWPILIQWLMEMLREFYLTWIMKNLLPMLLDTNIATLLTPMGTTLLLSHVDENLYIEMLKDPLIFRLSVGFLICVEFIRPL